MHFKQILLQWKINIMRRKHHQKKHRILTLAKQQNSCLPSSQSQILDQPAPDLEHEVQEALHAKDGSQFAPENHQTFSPTKKENFKECKIRELLQAKNYSPTHSDIDYMDTMENYKSYLNKTHDFKTGNQSLLSFRQKQKQRTKTIQPDKMQRQIKTSIGQSKNPELSMIKEKIDRIKSLQSNDNSPDRSFMKIYDKIQKIKLQEKGIKLSDSFCLLSVNEYVQMSKKLQEIIGNSNSSNMSRFVCYKAAKKPLSQQAKKWYCPKAYRTERSIDPEGLIKTITLEKWNDKKSERQNLARPLTVSNYKGKTENLQYQKSIEKPSSKPNQHHRPSTAPSKKGTSKFRTETININTRKTCTIEYKQKLMNETKSDINVILPLRKKVKGVRHVEREKFDWKDYKNQSQRCQKMENPMRSKTEMIFQYPWNWIKFQDSTEIHAKQWKA